MNLKLGIHAYDISLYINYVFILVGYELWLLHVWPQIFYSFILVKVKIDHFFCLNGDIWNFIFTEMVIELLSFIWLLSKSLNFIG